MNYPHWKAKNQQAPNGSLSVAKAGPIRSTHVLLSYLARIIRKALSLTSDARPYNRIPHLLSAPSHVHRVLYIVFPTTSLSQHLSCLPFARVTCLDVPPFPVAVKPPEGRRLIIALGALPLQSFGVVVKPPEGGRLIIAQGAAEGGTLGYDHDPHPKPEP